MHSMASGPGYSGRRLLLTTIRRPRARQVRKTGQTSPPIESRAALIHGELIPSLFYIASGAFGFGEYLPFLISTLVILMVAAVVGALPYSEDEGTTAA